MPLIDDLHRYYEEQGILATRFTCTHQDACCAGSECFTGPKSAYVGRCYDDAHRVGLPRLLFVSLDSGSAEADPWKRLPDAVRRQTTEQCLGRRNRHWYRTHELAACIFNRVRGTCMAPREAQPYFAHANSAKCCQNNPGRRQAATRLFRNGRPYLAGELAVLRPDVIVTQGVQAKNGVSSVAGYSPPMDQAANLVQLAGREVFWLHTHHPSAFGRFYPQRRQWGDFAKKIREFVGKLGI